MNNDVSVSREKLRKPDSVTNFWLNTIALVPVLCALYWLRQHRSSASRDMMVLLASAAVPIVVLDVAVLRVHRRASTGLDWEKEQGGDLARVLTKLLGLALTIGLIALAFWTFPEYHGSFYEPLYSALRGDAVFFKTVHVPSWLSLMVVAATYVWFVDGLMREPRDAYWQLGRCVLGRFRDARAFDVANHFRGWLVKAYFFPLMFVWLHGSVHELISFDFSGAALSNLRVYDYLYTLIFGLDLLFTTAGYALSLRVIDTHIRTAEPTVYGWVVALFCYQPFFSLMERQYVAYGGNVTFVSWFDHWPALPWDWAMPALRWAYAIVILSLLSIYTLATIAFGMRFSNLTHRGILTGGPYRFSKHPAYVTKNISWWLVSVPFLHAPWWEAVHHCLALGCINMIYFLRARTEERHLSRDPDYVAYALWMNEHGVLRFLGRWFPLLRYKPPAQPALAELSAAAE
ncbi:MAG TPA: isoprenylcysteine carboxylmethyltransferase family protein [Polyangiaceae bacterium]|nr:isoprenylcysteine carboxylmethyltransferase family protein [Polyangiaceae bacterium]